MLGVKSFCMDLLFGFPSKASLCVNPFSTSSLRGRGSFLDLLGLGVESLLHASGGSSWAVC